MPLPMPTYLPPAGYGAPGACLCQSAHMQRRRTCCFTLNTLPTHHEYLHREQLTRPVLSRFW